MTSKERLINAAIGREVDTIPVSPRLGYASSIHYRGNDLISNLRLKKERYDFDPTFILPGNNYPFYDPYELFKGKNGVDLEIIQKDAGPKREVRRVIKTPAGTLSETYLVPKPGRKEYGENPNPMHTEHLVKEQSDLRALRYLMPEPDESFLNQYMNTAAVIGEEGLCLATVYGPLDHQAGSAMAMEDIMVAYLTDRSFAAELLNMFQDQIAAQTELLLEGGVRYFFLPYYYHSLSAGWSPEIFREWFLPMIKEQTARIHRYDGIVFYYDDGKMTDILPMLKEAGIDAAETCTPPPVGDFDIDQAVKNFGKDMTFKGYVDLIYVLQKGTVDDVRNQIRRFCESGERLILGTSDSMREGTPLENIEAYFAAGREFGKR
jgi:uroporphyrinogen-III decarboxylase